MRFSKRFFTAFITSSACWAGCALAFALALMTDRLVTQRAEAEFEYQTSSAEVAIQAQIHAYTDVLRGLRGLFYTNEKVTRAQFHDYVQQLDLEQSFPGIRSLNFAAQVLAKDKDAFEAAVRGDASLESGGQPGFSVTPQSEREVFHVLTYHEPIEKNLGSIGFDIASNPLVRKSLESSRDSGLLSASGRLIRFVGPHRHTGMAMRMPLYRRGMPLNTVEERRAAYYGSVGTGFDINALMLNALDKSIRRLMRIRLYDTGLSDEQRAAGTTDPAHLLFDSAAENTANRKARLRGPRDEEFLQRISLTVGSRIWEAEFAAPKSAMLGAFESTLPTSVFVLCLVATLLLYGTYYSLSLARERAVEIAREMTKDLRASEANLAEAQHMAQLGSWQYNPRSEHMTWSDETYHILGHEHSTPACLDQFLSCIHDGDRASIWTGIHDAVQSGEGFSLEHRIESHGGRSRWVQTIVRVDRSSDETLLRGTIMDITERKTALEALKRSQELLRELTVHQDRVKEEERKRIAREIHDELGQTLLALRLDIAMLEARTGQTHPRLNLKVRAVLGHIDATVKTIRTIINNLRPAVLDLGLVAAIEWQVSEFQRRSGIECELVLDKHEFVVDDTRATALFRVLQESLTNVLRHADASRVIIRLYQHQQQLVMKIADNGVGLFPDSRRKANSFGLVGVEERILALNGNCVISSVPGQGTTLTVHIPLEKIGPPVAAQL